MGVDRSKPSVALDLPRAERRQVLYDLVGIPDVVFSSFRLGSMKRLCCDYETLKEIEPQIVYCHLTGFSETGPYGDRPAFDLVTQALSGAMTIAANLVATSGHGYPNGRPEWQPFLRVCIASLTEGR